MQGKWIVPGMFTAMRPGIEFGNPPPLGVFTAIEPEVPHRKDRLGLGSQPEIHHVKVMGRLVDQKPSAVPLVPMPAPKVICAV